MTEEYEELITPWYEVWEGMRWHLYAEVEKTAISQPGAGPPWGEPCSGFTLSQLHQQARGLLSRCDGKAPSRPTDSVTT